MENAIFYSSSGLITYTSPYIDIKPLLDISPAFIDPVSDIKKNEIVLNYLPLSGGSDNAMSGPLYMSFNDINEVKSITSYISVSPWIPILHSSIVDTNCNNGSNFDVHLTESITLSNPINAIDGQIVKWRFFQDSSGSRTLTLDTKFNFGSDISSAILSIDPDEIDYLTVIYREDDDKFDVIDFKTGF